MSDTRQVCTMNCGPAKDDPLPWEERIRDCEDCITVPAPQQPTISDKLRALSKHMQDVAVEMDYFGGFAPWSQHSAELLGASGVVVCWAHEIEADKAKAAQ